jgi:hypothetical protein
MPITPFLNGVRFDLEGERVLRVAFEMVCIGLRTGDRDDGVKQAIAKKLIALAKTGERNPDILCEFHFAFPDFALRAGRELGIQYAAGVMGAGVEKL